MTTRGEDDVITSADAILVGLTGLFREVFDDDALVVGPETDADDVEGWDSGKMIELIVAAEARFGVKFTTREIDALANVGDFARLIAGKSSDPSHGAGRQPG